MLPFVVILAEPWIYRNATSREGDRNVDSSQTFCGRALLAVISAITRSVPPLAIFEGRIVRSFASSAIPR